MRRQMAVLLCGITFLFGVGLMPAPIDHVIMAQSDTPLPLPTPMETPARNAVFSFDDTQPALTPLYPTDETALNLDEVVFIWVRHPDANRYDLILYQDNELFFQHRFYSDEVCVETFCNIVATTWTNIPPFQPDSTYTWQINSRWDGENHEGIASHFSILPYPLLASLETENEANSQSSATASNIIDGKIAYISWAQMIHITTPNDWNQTQTQTLLGGCAYQANSPCYPQDLALSPDTGLIAFSARRMSDDPLPQPGAFDIYVMNTSGTAGFWITDDAAPENGLSWSPDGSKLAYSRYVMGESRYEIYVYNLFTLTATLLVGDGLHPTWSPDGTRLTYVEACDLKSVDIYGGSSPQLLLSGASSCSHDFNGLNRSPIANQYIYHSSSISSPGLRLLTFNAGGSTSIQLLTNGYHRFADWSPDGSRVVYDHADDPIPSLFFSIQSLRILTLQTGQSTLISPLIGAPYNNSGYYADWNGFATCPAGLELLGNTCSPFNTNTPTPTVNQTPTLTNTPVPTVTLTPTYTPSPAPTATPTVNPDDIESLFYSLLPPPPNNELAIALQAIQNIDIANFTNSTQIALPISLYGTCNAFNRLNCAKYTYLTFYALFIEMTGYPPTIWHLLSANYYGELKDWGMKETPNEALYRNFADNQIGGCRFNSVNYNCNYGYMVEWLSGMQHWLIDRTTGQITESQAIISPLKLSGITETNLTTLLREKPITVVGILDLIETGGMFDYDLHILRQVVAKHTLWRTGVGPDVPSYWGNEELTPAGVAHYVPNSEQYLPFIVHLFANGGYSVGEPNQSHFPPDGQTVVCTYVAVITTSQGRITTSACPPN